MGSRGQRWGSTAPAGGPAHAARGRAADPRDVRLTGRSVAALGHAASGAEGAGNGSDLGRCWNRCFGASKVVFQCISFIKCDESVVNNVITVVNMKFEFHQNEW